MNPQPLAEGHAKECPFDGEKVILWARNQFGITVTCSFCKVKVGPCETLFVALSRWNRRYSP